MFSLLVSEGILPFAACEKIVIFFNFIKIAKHTYSYAKFIGDRKMENLTHQLESERQLNQDMAKKLED